MYSVVYNSEEEFEIRALKLPRRRGETRTASQQKRDIFHSLPDSEIYTTEYILIPRSLGLLFNALKMATSILIRHGCMGA